MSVDEVLLDRIRDAVFESVERPSAVTERAMFGGVGFMIAGNMAVAASSRRGMMVRVGEAAADLVDEAAGSEPMTMRGRPVRNWLHVAADGLGSDEVLRRWVDIGVTFAASLPSK